MNIYTLMTQIVGFDAKETIRTDTKGNRYNYPLGVSVEIFDFNKFKERYDKSIKTISKKYDIENKRKVYSFQYFAKLYGMDSAIDISKCFLNEIKKNIITTNVYFTNISEIKTPKIFMYCEDGIGVKKPTKEFIKTLIQPYSYICAWKYLNENKNSKSKLFIDNFQAQTTRAWQKIQSNKPIIYYKGDLCNPVISTADMLAGVIDSEMQNSKFCIDSINEIVTKNLGLKGKTYLIGSPDLSYISPVSRQQIDTSMLLKHPVYYLITEKRPTEMDYYEFRDQFEFSKIFDDIVNIAYENNGSIKLYEASRDYKFFTKDDRIIYYEKNGKEIAESLINQQYIDTALHYGHDKIK